MIVLFTVFGLADPYVGQPHGVLAREAPGVPVIDLLHAVPNYDIPSRRRPSLPAFVPEFPPESVFVCVVDPGVGSDRRPVMLRAAERWFVGPDNGLVPHPRAPRTQPTPAATSFGLRGAFRRASTAATRSPPVAARLALGEVPESEPTMLTVPNGEWPDDLAEVIYIDHFGNVITGIRAKRLKPELSLRSSSSCIFGTRRRLATCRSGRGFGMKTRTGWWRSQ